MKKIISKFVVLSLLLTLFTVSTPQTVNAGLFQQIFYGKTKTLKTPNGKKAVWRTSNSNVMSVTQNGKIKAQKLGYVLITAKTSSVIYEWYFQVVPYKTETVWEDDVSLPKGITKKSLILGVGATDTISLNRIEGPVLWSVSNTNVATIKTDGVRCQIKAKKAGTATVKATVNGKTYSCKITVIKKGIKVSKSTITVEVGKKQTVTVTSSDTLTAISYDEDIIDYDWGKTSGNKSVLNIKGLKSGTAYIDIETKHTNEIKTIKVIVKKANTSVSKPNSETMTEYQKLKSEWLTEDNNKYEIYWLYDYILIKDDFNSYKIYDLPAGGFEEGKIYNGTYNGHAIRIQYIGLLKTSDATYIVNSICINKQDLIDAGIISK